MVGDRMFGHNFLRFANAAQGDVLGQFLSDLRTYDRGDCLLYQDGGCLIWLVRPKDAQDQVCWEENGSSHEAIESWADGEMEKFGVKDFSEECDYEDW